MFAPVDTSAANQSRRQLFSMGARGALAVAIAASTASTTLNIKPAEAGNCGNDKDNGNAQGCNCFLRGTTISTPSGSRKIEDLSLGDLVVTGDGGASPVQFVSRRAYKKTASDRDWVRDVRPILVRKSAISRNVPSRDLYLTRFHALYLDGMFFPVGNLINGLTIVEAAMADVEELEYFHIKLDTHDVIFAEGTACESLLKVTEAAANFADYYRTYGFPADEEEPYAPIHSFNGGRSEFMSRIRSAASAVVEVRRPLDFVRDRLEARALALVAA